MVILPRISDKLPLLSYNLQLLLELSREGRLLSRLTSSSSIMTNLWCNLSLAPALLKSDNTATLDDKQPVETDAQPARKKARKMQ